MDQDPLCKRDGCGHPLSVHNARRAEKRAHNRGTMLSDYPLSTSEHFNILIGRGDNDACDKAECGCETFG